MSKKEYFLIGLVVVLAGLYTVYFTDWFRPRQMRVEHSTRSPRNAYTGSGTRVDPSGKGLLGNVTFSLHHNYRLTSIKVVHAADFQTNKYAPAIWELVSEKGSQPVNGFAYGCMVPGMAPARPGLDPQPLDPGVEYRLIVCAGKLIGEHDFALAKSGAPVR
jgi:hypothetical protein